MEAGRDLLFMRMFSQAEQWRQQHDHRFIFLECYATMTQNMLATVSANRFQDPDWVSRLLHHFAAYYFNALDQFERGDPATPAVWEQTHASSLKQNLHVLQHLFLGINAHINYDLVFAVADLLQPEWTGLSPAGKRRRYEDHCQVNEIIAETIDAVQDGIIAKQAPQFDFLDRVLGRLDEKAVAHVISRWRDEVWHQATAYLFAPETDRISLIKAVEERALSRGERLLKWVL